jgi:hypothetical protein
LIEHVVLFPLGQGGVLIRPPRTVRAAKDRLGLGSPLSDPATRFGRLVLPVVLAGRFCARRKPVASPSAGPAGLPTP